MLKNSRFIKNENMVVAEREKWRNMGFNDRTKQLENKGGIPNFKRAFEVRKAVQSATLTVTALGIFEVYINNQRVGRRNGAANEYDELKPGWTDYNARVFAFEYDVSNLLVLGTNSILAEVSCGWYSCRISFGIYGFNQPAFCCELNIKYQDGTSEMICTDETWQTALCGPVMTADIWDGEFYDAGIQRGDENADWQSVSIMDSYCGKIVPAFGPRISVRSEISLSPISATVYKGTVQNGTEYGKINITYQSNEKNCEAVVLKCGESIVIDMGQNAAGRPAIEIKAKRGTQLTFYFAELLNDSGDPQRGNDGAMGSVYIKNYRAALSRLVYICSGNGIEKYSPKHTFFGFRYLEITASDNVEIISIKNEVVGSVLKETCTFSCSNAKVNKLWSNIVWGQRSNYISVPTDCPQRDERLGWTGDTQIFCGAGSYIADIYDFMRKWLQDARDSQGDDGSYCDVIPKVFRNPNFIGNAAWTDAGIIVPYKMYVKYGDDTILKEHFASMEKYMEYVLSFGLEGANTAYGDWLCYEVTDKRYIAVCYLAYTVNIMAKCAHVLGKSDREKHYRRLYLQVQKHFRDRYIKDEKISEQTQTGYLLALKFGLLPMSMRKSCTNALKQKIERNDFTLSTGFVGTGVLCTTLSELGLHDLCYSLLLQTKDPSWLYSVCQGATTVWERWNSYTLKSGFGDVNMNSFNHYAYGAVAEWLIAYMAGIQPPMRSNGRIIIAPKPDFRSQIPDGQTRITCANAAFDSVRGRIESSWRFENDSTVYNVNAPCKFQLVLPLNGKTRIVINNKPLTVPSHVKTFVLNLIGGEYTITV